MADKDIDDISDSDLNKLLDDFLGSEMPEIDSTVSDDKEKAKPQEKPQIKSRQDDPTAGMDVFSDNPPAPEEKAAKMPSKSDVSLEELGDSERELMKAYTNFLEAVYTVASLSNVQTPEFMFNSGMLIPNYKPKYGKIVSEDILEGWDLLLKTHYNEFKDLDMSGDDDAFLNYAEKLSDPNLQFAIVSYIEVLIELEGCEISYEQRKLRARKRRIEIEFMEEQRRKNERKQHFIEAVAAKHFPINAEQLITNYIKTANKDPDGAYKALTENPAIYAPIETNKIKPRLFGLIKKSPKDGIRMNKKIGKFLKNLRA